MLFIVASGCKKQEVPAAAPDATTPIVASPTDDRFIVANAVQSKSALPERYAAALPFTIDEIRGDWAKYPPRSMVESALCAGDAAMQAKFREAVTLGGRANNSPELSRAFAALMGYCATRPKCEWLEKLATDKREDPFVRSVAWGGLSRCTDGRYAALFESPDSPAQAVIDWHFSSGSSGRRFPSTERLRTAATEIASSGQPYEVRKVGFALARDDEDSVSAILAVQKGLKDPHRKALVALGLHQHADPRARAAVKRACAHPKLKNDAVCATGTPLPKAAPKPNNLGEVVRDYGSDVEAMVKAEPKQRTLIVEALAQCALGRNKNDSDIVVARCLTRLARIDRARAVQAAQSMPKKRRAHPALSELTHALERFSAPDALRAHLVELDLIDAQWTAPPPEPLTASELLIAAGRSINFDTETGTFPNGHDALLADLARLARPALDDVVFEEIPPPDPDDTSAYEIRAYAGGQRWSLSAKNLGDWFDLEAVIGLLNQLLVQKNSDVRFAVLPTGDQTATVIAASDDALTQAGEAGLIQFGTPTEAAEAGKDFERKVFDALQRRE